MKEIISHKWCPKCKKNKSVDLFNKSKQNRNIDGLYGWCKNCQKDKNAEYYKNNHDRINARNALYNERHKETIKVKSAEWKIANRDLLKERNTKYYNKTRDRQLEAGRVYRENNKAKVREAIKKWHNANRDKTIISKHNRRLRETNNTKPITAQEWANLKEKHGNKCLCCGRTDIKLTMDHIIPLSKNGSNSIENIQPLCGPCNSRKHDKTIDYR